MEKQILSDMEIESIFQFKRDIKDRINILDLFHALNEKTGLYEAEKSLLSDKDKRIVMTELERRRSNLEQRALMTSGDVKYNPEGLICPKCGCTYIVLYKYSSYLRKTTERPLRTGQRLSAEGAWFTQEYNFCLGCGNEFSL